MPWTLQDTCDIISVALYPNPLASRGVAADILVLIYMAIFGSYWAWSAVHFATDVRDMHEVGRDLGPPVETGRCRCYLVGEA
jgi:hypothetical protein